jgi:hypothetical protein
LSKTTFVDEYLDWRIGGRGKIDMVRGSTRFFLAAALLSVAQAAQGGETVTYDYDSLGRLTKVSRSGTVNSGVEARYTYDSADNRTNVTVDGAPPASAAAPPGAVAISPPPTAVAPADTDAPPAAAVGEHGEEPQ